MIIMDPRVPFDRNKDELRSCPDCPDGYVWTERGPTDKECPTCKGYAVVKVEPKHEESGNG